MSIKRNHSVDLGAAIMQPGRQTSTTGNVVALGETPMILTLDQLRPNPDTHSAPRGLPTVCSTVSRYRPCSTRPGRSDCGARCR
ncbi:hypothetical protein KZN37_005213 [Escherichia coli]|nr:hypothetical protein [Escherichia coli]